MFLHCYDSVVTVLACAGIQGSNTSYIRSQVVDEERLSTAWVSAFCSIQCFDADGLLAEGHPLHKRPVLLITTGSFLDLMGEKDTR